MNRLLQIVLSCAGIVIIWNIMRYFLETIYANRLTEEYIVFTTQYHLNIILFVFCFFLFITIDYFMNKSKMNIPTLPTTKNNAK